LVRQGGRDRGKDASRRCTFNVERRRKEGAQCGGRIAAERKNLKDRVERSTT